MSKLLKKMILTIKSKLELQLSMKINRLFILLSAKMIGNLNANELLTNLRFKIKLITNNGEQGQIQQETQQILSRKSILCIYYSFPNTRSILQKLNDDLTSTLDKISKSERMINSSMSDIGDQYKSQSEELKTLSSHFNNLSTAMKQMNENYRLISEKLEQIQVKYIINSGKNKRTFRHNDRHFPCRKNKIGIKEHADINKINGCQIRCSQSYSSSIQIKIKKSR